MYSTCLFCHAALGANDSIEHFPVGKRLAFDGDRGRLWAVCPHCERWNLAPVEERWEALEDCEKAYRAAAKRVSTDNIALARLKDGTDLVRIGQPLLPEFAAWRYSRTFLRRTYLATARRSVPGALINGAGTFAVAKATGMASATVLIAAPAITIASMFAAGGLLVWRQRQPNALLLSSAATLRGVAQADLGWTRISHDDDAGLALRLKTREVRPTGRIGRVLGLRAVPANAEPASETIVTGDVAHALLGQVLARINTFDASGHVVQEAIERAERYQSPNDETPSAIAVLAPRIAGYRGSLFGAGESIGLLSPVNRLAAEMTLHEDDERRALAGELGALYARWEEAERVAKIADRLP